MITFAIHSRVPLCVFVSFHSIPWPWCTIKGGICDKSRYRWNLFNLYLSFLFPFPFPFPYLIMCIFHLSARVGFVIGLECEIVLWVNLCYFHVENMLFENKSLYGFQWQGQCLDEQTVEPATPWNENQSNWPFFTPPPPTHPPSTHPLASARSLTHRLAFQYNCIKLSMHYVLERLESLVCVLLRHIVRFFIHCLH